MTCPYFMGTILGRFFTTKGVLPVLSVMAIEKTRPAGEILYKLADGDSLSLLGGGQRRQALALSLQFRRQGEDAQLRRLSRRVARPGADETRRGEEAPPGRRRCLTAKEAGQARRSDGRTQHIRCPSRLRKSLHWRVLIELEWPARWNWMSVFPSRQFGFRALPHVGCRSLGIRTRL